MEGGLILDGQVYITDSDWIYPYACGYWLRAWKRTRPDRLALSTVQEPLDPSGISMTLNFMGAPRDNAL
jgi:hypothetical protein